MIKDYNPSNVISPKIIQQNGMDYEDQDGENKEGPQSGLDTIIANEQQIKN